MLYLFLFIAFLATTITIIRANRSLAPWVPTRTRDLKRIRALANLKSNEKFYDIGSGDGKVALYIAKHTQAQVVGIEIVLTLYFICWLKQLLARLPNLTFLNKNMFAHNLSDANCIYVFGLPDKLQGKFQKKLETELKPGTRVISYCFPFKNWKEVTKDKPRDTELAIYLYIK